MKRFRANTIVWGMPKGLSTLEIRTKLADLGLVDFAGGAVAWEGYHVNWFCCRRIAKALARKLPISACVRRIGCSLAPHSLL